MNKAVEALKVIHLKELEKENETLRNQLERIQKDLLIQDRLMGKLILSNRDILMDVNRIE